MNYEERNIDELSVWKKAEPIYASNMETGIWVAGLILLVLTLVLFAHSQGWTWN